jgi:hypothetical protein
MPKKKQQSKRKISETTPSMFDNLEESFLVELALYYPDQLKMMCMLSSLDVQMIKEGKSYDTEGKI